MPSMAITYKGRLMDEVQTDAEPQEEVAPESAPGETEASEGGESQEEKVIFDERQQAKVNELISGKVAKTHEERRLKEDAQRQLEEFKASQPKPEAPDIPPMPDSDLAVDDPAKFRTQQEEREKAITARAAFDANQDLLRQQDERAAFDRQQKQEADTRQAITKYTEVAQSFGIDAVKMQQDATTVVQSGVPTEFADFLATDPQGPLITSHLAGNMAELDMVSRMTPMQAASHIATEIRPKLKGARKSTQAPPPPGIVDGQGTPAKERGPKGAKYE